MASHGATAVIPANQYCALRMMSLYVYSSSIINYPNFFPLINGTRANLLTSNAVDDNSTNTEQGTQEDAVDNLPQNAHVSIRNMMRSLQQLSTTMPRTAVDITQQSAWLDRLNVTEFETHRILENDLNLQTVGSSSFTEWRAYPIAGSIFLCLWLRQLSLRSNVFDYLVDSLVYALKEEEEEEVAAMEQDNEEQHYPTNVLLWFLFVGGAAAEGRRNRQWFLGQISQTLRKLDLNSWQSTQGLLTVFPYVEECEGSYKKIWEELESGKLVE
jgi:hypothetical protein